MAAKTVKAVSSKKVWCILGGVTIVAGATAWGISAASRAEVQAVEVPPECTVEAIKSRSEQEPRFREFRETMQREDLTDEQKRQIMRNEREVWHSRMQARVDEYFNAPPEKQTAILDRQIDEMQEMFQRFRQEREARGNREGRGGEEGPSREERESMRRLMGPQTQQERKARSESRNPDEMARTMAYFGAVRKRAAERGIQLPRGPGGRGGPGGAGPDGRRGSGSRGGRRGP